MGVIDYLRDVRGELRHVTWPTRDQAIAYTAIVLAFSISTGVFLGLLDAAFIEGLKRLIETVRAAFA